MAPPLIFVVVVSMIKDAYEDVMRHIEDSKENGEKTRKYSKKAGKYVECAWKDVRIGDFLRIQENEFFPSDMLLMSSSEAEGICYVETKNLDGETNLKNKVAIRETDPEFESDGSPLRRLPTGQINVEYPNNRIYKFDGQFILDIYPENGGTMPLS